MDENENHQKSGNNIINERQEIIKTKPIQEIIEEEDIINFISTKLYSIISDNKLNKKKQSRGENEPFYGKKFPLLNLKKYLERIIKYTEIENNTLIVAYLYIMKLINKENFVLGINNIYRLLLGAAVLAKKTLEDINYGNSYYCDIAGISVDDLNKIEESLFDRIDFDVNLKMEDVTEVYNDIFNGLSNLRLNELLQKANINNKNSNNIKEGDIKSKNINKKES